MKRYGSNDYRDKLHTVLQGGAFQTLAKDLMGRIEQAHVTQLIKATGWPDVIRTTGAHKEPQDRLCPVTNCGYNWLPTLPGCQILGRCAET